MMHSESGRARHERRPLVAIHTQRSWVQNRVRKRNVTMRSVLALWARSWMIVNARGVLGRIGRKCNSDGR
jgi:hypothetical protein